ncbi:MAG: hypothetical protein PHQ40_19630 [Anaerolineaceae bacterium]|nr:hypothetical protein [Anaerolineaceae bacterium]
MSRGSFSHRRIVKIGALGGDEGEMLSLDEMDAQVVGLDWGKYDDAR